MNDEFILSLLFTPIMDAFTFYVIGMKKQVIVI